MIDFIIILLVSATMVSATYVVSSKNLVRSAVALFFTLFSIAGLYILLYADFVAGAQIMIYVGGILVLIIFGEIVVTPSKETLLVDLITTVSICSNSLLSTGLKMYFSSGFRFKVI